MNKRKLIAALLLTTFSAYSYAQQPETSKDKKAKAGTVKKEAKKVIIVNGENGEEEITVDDAGADKKKKEKKVKVYVNGDKKSTDKKVTVIVDGDKVTVNGKPVEEMSDEDIEIVRGNGDHLKLIAPYFRRRMSGGEFNVPVPPNAPEIDMNFDDLIREMTPPNKALLGVVTEKDDKGARVNNISEESAAEKAGLQKDDIITKVNDDIVESSDDLIKAIGKYAPDEKVKIAYIRDGKNKTTEATLQKNNIKQPKVYTWNNRNEMPMEIAPFGDGQNFDFKVFKNMGRPKIGLKIQDIEEGNGVKVLDVDAETPAGKAGLQKDDIIIAINGEVIKNVDALKEKLAGANEGDVFKVKFSRNGSEQTVDLRFPKKLKTADL